MTRVTTKIALGPFRWVQVVETKPEDEQESAIETEGESVRPGLAKAHPSVESCAIVLGGAS